MRYIGPSGRDLLQQQADTLVRHGYPAEAGLSEEEFRDTCFKSLTSAAFGAKPPAEVSHIPFIVVIPDAIVPLRWQLQQIEYGEYAPEMYINPNDYEHPASYQKQPYLAVDVEYGQRMCNVSPSDAYILAEHHGRSLLGFGEVVALLTHFPETLNSHNVHAAGSVLREGDREFTLDIYLYACSIKVKRDPRYKADPRWGAPTCKYRANL
jgi:hypothetical protein